MVRQVWDTEHQLWFWVTGNKLNREMLTADKVAALESTPGWTWEVSAEDEEAYEHDAALLRVAKGLGSLPDRLLSLPDSIPGWTWGRN